MLCAVNSQVVKGKERSKKKKALTSVRAEKKEKLKAKSAAKSINRRSQIQQNVAMNLLGSLKGFFICRQTSFNKIYISL